MHLHYVGMVEQLENLNLPHYTFHIRRLYDTRFLEDFDRDLNLVQKMGTGSRVDLLIPSRTLPNVPSPIVLPTA
jgi:hypothetical protein